MRDPRVLEPSEALKALHANLPPTKATFLAFYSSALGGIVTDPAFFVVPLDEHMVHRGHAVFDTCNVVNYKAYGIDFHLDRLLRSAKLANIRPRFTKSELRTIILATIAAARRRDDVFVRFWLTAGRGDFSVSSRHTQGSNFLVVVHQYKSKQDYKTQGVHEFTVTVPIKPPLLATIKSNNYLLNALTCEEAEEKGGFLGIQLDGDGRLAEGSIGNVAILDKHGYLRTPPFERILAGTTVKRLWELGSPSLVDRGLVKGIRYDAITLDEITSAKEVYSLGGGGIVPVVSVNGVKIGDGRPGPVFIELDAILQRDMEESEYLDDIPYDQYSGGSWLQRTRTNVVRAVVRRKWWWIAMAAYVIGYRAGVRKSIIFYL